MWITGEESGFCCMPACFRLLRPTDSIAHAKFILPRKSLLLFWLLPCQIETNQFSESVELKPKSRFKMYLAGNWQAYLPAPHQCFPAQVLSLLGSNTRWNKNKQFFPNSCLLKFTYKIKWFFILLLYPLASCSTGCFMHKSFIADTLPIIFSQNW